MTTFLIAVGSFFAFLIAYHTYGRWLARKVFGLDPNAPVPAEELQDNVDFCPTKRQVVFGHHFTSIAGTGPIVGPAIAVFWGWLPALLWVIFGSIFIGAVHDFGALVVSLRNRGQTVGEIAGRMIAPRARILFLLILFFALLIVLAIFGLVIASIFALYPSSVIPVWISMPLAVFVGYWSFRLKRSLLPLSLIVLGIVYLSVYVGAYYFEVRLPGEGSTPILIWTTLLFIYCFAASVLPVWLLLQPRDFINSQQLLVALALLVAGLLLASLTGQANLIEAAPARAVNLPEGAPPIWPFLFITIACGAVSGFHCLVSSGTSSKQLAKETDAQYVGYGAMLLEGALAVIVIMACCAGIGMGAIEKVETENGTRIWRPVAVADAATVGQTPQYLEGRAAWESKYDATSAWGKFGLGQKVGAFVEGGAMFLFAIGIPLQLGVTLIAVLVASFAATTLDTATRLQRYVVQELGSTLKIPPLQNKYGATMFAVVTALLIAVIPSGNSGLGTGGLLLWPLFGATNQLLAGLAFLVTVFYLWRRNKPILFAVIPMLIMLVMPFWALTLNLFSSDGFLARGDYHLFAIGLLVLCLQVWMVIEAILVWPKARGVLEETLPPLNKTPQQLSKTS